MTKVEKILYELNNVRKQKKEGKSSRYQDLPVPERNFFGYFKKLFYLMQNYLSMQKLDISVQNVDSFNEFLK